MTKTIRTIGTMVGLLLPLTSIGLSGVAEAQTAPGDRGNCVSRAASQYPPGRTTLAVDRGQSQAGGVVVASGCGTPNGQVNFTLFSHPKALGSATTDNVGFYRASLTLPCDTEQGAHTLRASGAANDSANLNVSGTTGACASGATTTAGQDRGREQLPRTGSSSTAPLAAAGAGLVLIGAATAITARRRRSAESA